MIKRNFLLSFWVLCTFVTLAQDKNYTVYFRSEQLIPSANIEQWPEILTNTTIIYNNNSFVCVQFYTIPTSVQKEQLKSLGIQLFSYLPRYTYMAAMPENISINALSKLGIRSIFVLENMQKIHPHLVQNDYPNWAISNDGKIKIKLLLFPSVSIEEAKTYLLKTHTVSEIQVNAFFHELSMQMDTASLQSLASIPFIQFIEAIDPPSAPDNFVERTDHRTNILSSEYAGGRHYDGSGIKIALGDDGPIGPHIDYQGRIGSLHVTDNTGNHGDHVAGTIMGAGNLDPQAKGMAPGAEIHVYDVWDAIDSSIFSYYDPGISITSISYSNGCNAGYTTRAYNLDQQVRLMPSLSPVFSAGNDGTLDCSYGAGAGWGNVTGGIKIAKNCITVANLDGVDNLSASSSRGPATDGRLKPDISAVGTDVYSTIDVNSYELKSGTSMACPGVSGTLASLYDAYVSINGNLPDAAVMKGILLNSADDIGNPGPDFKTGWGRMNARRAVKTLEENRWFVDSISQGQINTHQIIVPAGVSQFRVMVYWNDYEGTINASTALVNDIDMQITAPDLTIYNPWVLNSTPDSLLLDANATRAHDTLNNVEQVTIDSAAAGIYQISISGYVIPQGIQKYVVVYEFLDSSIALTYPVGGESLVPNTMELIRWDTYGGTSKFNLEYSADSGSTWASIASGIPPTQSYYEWLVPDTISGHCLIRINNGSLYDVSDTLFSIINVPQNLKVDTACMNHLTLVWDSVAGATSYDVFKLGTMYMDSIGNSSSTYFSYAINNPYYDYDWFAVRARGKNDAVGRRCNAIEFDSTGVSNCILEKDIELSSITSPEKAYPSCGAISGIPITISIHNTGKQDISNFYVSYLLSGNSIVTEQYGDTIVSGSSASYSFNQTISVSLAGTYSLLVWVNDSLSDNPYNDTLSMNFIVLNSYLFSVPLTQDFENFTLCSTTSSCGQDSCELGDGWINISNNGLDDIDWRVNEGTTPSSSTGPSKDHTLNTSSGNYIYLEATSCFNHSAELITPCFDLTGTNAPSLSFWYSMYGSDMGSLHVNLFSEGQWIQDIFADSGSHNSLWINKIIDLKNYVGKTVAFCFKGITGDGYMSDMALDDIGITEASSINKINNSTIVNVWPNPSNGFLTVSIKNKNTAIIKMQLTDISGKEILNTDAENASTFYKKQLDLNFLAKGLYILKINVGEQAQYIKITKQ